ncbi:MAG: histidine kinase [Myxococcaceae bacterium]|nr:histidine kinase [Myxococcaceae bacterium]
MSAILESPPAAGSTDEADGAGDAGTAEPAAARAAELLLQAMRELSRARTPEVIAGIVKQVARALVDADGATFVLRDRDHCYYLDEDAISPLWKGQRFAKETCVSGWVMTHAQQVVMQDIYADPRAAQAIYRPTFVKSLVMTPVRRVEPVAAIGIYWARTHRASERELALLQDLADTTAVALENAAVYAELEHRVAERTEQLLVVNRELEAFSYSVAHDLRSPLSAVLGFAELIEDRLPPSHDENIALFASEIIVAGKRMNDLIGALLDFSRCARATLARVPFELSVHARAIGDRLLSAAHSQAELTIEPGLCVRADPPLLELVLTNLLSNALKYSSKKSQPRIELGQLQEDSSYGGQSLRGLARPSDESTHSRTFFVRDNGAGFDPKHSEQLFVPFQRLHKQREFDGTGVGLATVARIIRRHGGRIWAEGRPDEGATFFFSLPNED